MHWSTAISHVQDGREIVRGYDLRELIKQKTFAEVIFLVLKGELPNAAETRMMNALFTAAIDHGIGVSSAMTARTVVSTGNSLHTALAAGILALGTLHGSAIEDAAKFFQNHKDETDLPGLVKKLRAEHFRIPGYGHKILNHDPRTDALFTVARETGFYGHFCKMAETIHVALQAGATKSLPLNVDGSMAAVISDMGFDWRLAKGFFIIGRVPGLVAHVYEEMINGSGLRRLSQEESTYTGPPERTA